MVLEKLSAGGRWHSLLRLIIIQDLRKELMDLALQKDGAGRRTLWRGDRACGSAEC